MNVYQTEVAVRYERLVRWIRLYHDTLRRARKCQMQGQDDSEAQALAAQLRQSIEEDLYLLFPMFRHPWDVERNSAFKILWLLTDDDGNTLLHLLAFNRLQKAMDYAVRNIAQDHGDPVALLKQCNHRGVSVADIMPEFAEKFVI